MITVKCIQKFKKNNRIYGYQLQDSQGNTKDVTPDQLKTAIRNNQINIVNLTLTLDNRLIDTTKTEQPQEQVPQILEEQKIKNIILKSKALGLPVKEIKAYCNYKCYLISKSNTEHIIYIPEDVLRLNKDQYNLTFTKHIRDIQGTLKVIGGHNLKNTSYMFKYCKAQSIDLSYFNTSKVTNMHSMFDNCQAKYIDLSSFDTSKAEDMRYMFYECKAQSLDLSSFDTSNVTDMCGIFYKCQAQFIDLSSFNISNVIYRGGMFEDCQAQIKATDQKILEKYKNR